MARKLRIGSRTIRIATIVTVVIVIGSIIFGTSLLLNQSTTAGTQVKWTFIAADGDSHPIAGMGFSLVEQDGTVIITAYHSVTDITTTRGKFVALNPNCTVKWEAAFNGYIYQIVKGNDGQYYYTDYNNAADPSNYWEINNTIQNLTSLDASGKYRWSFQVDNGTIQLWATYSDGEVIVHHFAEGSYNETIGATVDKVDEIIALSANGKVMWRGDLPSYYGEVVTDYSSPLIRQNETFIVYASYYANETIYQLGYNRFDGSYYSVQVDYVPLHTSNGPNLLYYERKVDSVTNEVGVYASYTNNASYAWKTVIETLGYHFPGGYSNISCLVDGKGIIYSWDVQQNRIFALSSDGKILWNKTGLGMISSAFPTGGILCRLDSTFIKVNGDGTTAWQTGPNTGSEPYFTAIGPDGTVYYIQDNSVRALVQSDFSNNLLLLVLLIFIDLVVVIFYVAVHKKNNKRQLIHQESNGTIKPKS